MKLLIALNIVTLIALMVCIGWCVTLELRSADIESRIAHLSDIAGEYEVLNTQLSEVQDDLQRESTRNRETIDASISDMERMLQRELRNMRKDMEPMSKASPSPAPSSAKPESNKAAETGDLLGGLPELNDSILAEAMGHLGPMLGLDDGQKEEFNEILRKNLSEINALRAEVEAGERTAEDAMAKAEGILDKISEDVEPILNETQAQIFTQLIAVFREQATDYL